MMSEEYLDTRTPPHSTEAEQAVIGAVFLEPEAMSTASEFLIPQDFYRPSHQRIFQVMMQLNDRGEPIDLLTVTNALNSSKLLEEVGGVSYLTELADAVPTAANIGYYTKIVEEKSVLRRLIRTATDIVTESFNREDELEDVLSEAEKNILDVSNRQNANAFKNIKDVLIDVYDNIEQLHEKSGDVTGIPTGFKDLDHITSGFQRNDLIIVAARPSVGKTLLP